MSYIHKDLLARILRKNGHDELAKEMEKSVVESGRVCECHNPMIGVSIVETLGDIYCFCCRQECSGRQDIEVRWRAEDEIYQSLIRPEGYQGAGFQVKGE